MTPELLTNLKQFAPEMTVVGFLSALFLFDGFIPKVRTSRFPLYLVLVACLAGIWVTHCGTGTAGSLFGGMVSSNGLLRFFRYFFFGSTAIATFASLNSREIENRGRSEFAILILCVLFGMGLMAASSHLLLLYVGIETVSIVSFVLAGFSRDSLRSNEASFKYLVYGALASGLMIYGISLIYGYAGTLYYPGIAEALVKGAPAHPLILPVALLLVYSGFAYKISAFPFHFWTPDVYEGAPTPITGFFSVGPKAAGFAAIMGFVLTVLSTRDAATGAIKPIDGINWVPFVAIISAITMVVGNWTAVGQTNVKRILAYSSIAHVGYVLMGFVALSRDGLAAILFYLVAYCLMNLGAFWVVGIVADIKGRDDLTAFKGIGWQMPALGVCMAVFLFSLTGIPLFSGFIGKFLIFGSLLQSETYLWLALLGVLNSVISLFYYVKILKAIWLDKPEASQVGNGLAVYESVGLIGLAVPTVVLGLFFGPVIEATRNWLASF